MGAPDEQYLCVYRGKMCALCVVEVEIGQSSPPPAGWNRRNIENWTSCRGESYIVLSLGGGGDGEKFVSFYEAPCYKNRPPFLLAWPGLVDAV